MKKSCILALLSSVAVFAADFQTGQAARAVLGQATFGNQSDVTTQTSVGAASGLFYLNGTLFVAGSNRISATPSDNRVLGYNVQSVFLQSPRGGDLIGTRNRCDLCGFSASFVLGQPDFTSNAAVASDRGMRTPTAVASDGVRLAVADTDNNRILIWNSVPSVSTAPANVVLGQPDFATVQAGAGTNAQRLRGPQGVWFAAGHLYVADTQNHRVLVWNNIPTQNNQAADFALGQPDLNSANGAPISTTPPPTAETQLLNPVSVTSDGTRLFVSDLGFNRVLIWNTLPTRNQQPADVVIGQQTMNTSRANNSAGVCPVASTDSAGVATYVPRCERTLSFPRFALAHQGRLYIADGGNNRVLIYNTIPTANGAGADIVLGQSNMYADDVSDTEQSIISTVVNQSGSSNTIRTPMSLAFDDINNLYVSDPDDRRVLVFAPSDTNLDLGAVVNAFNQTPRAQGFVAVTGTITVDNTATITVGGTGYTYTVRTGDTVDTVAQGLANAINGANSNAGDPNVFARIGNIRQLVTLSAKNPGTPGNSIALSASVSSAATIQLAASGIYLAGGNASTLAPGALITINAPPGVSLSEETATAPTGVTLPRSLGNVQVFIDGYPAPLTDVSPQRIVAQLPYAFADPFTFRTSNSASVYVRTFRPSTGTVTTTNAVGVRVTDSNPGLQGTGTSEPQTAVARHAATNALAVVSFDGTVTAGNTATVTVNGRAYTYTLVAGDTTASVRDNILNRINGSGGAADPQVIASAGGAFARLVLTARTPGPGGSGISIQVSTSASATITLSPYTDSTCCGNANAGEAITPANPARPGELVTLVGTGLGLPTDLNLQYALLTGEPYQGPQPNSPANPVDATIGGTTAQVINVTVPPFGIGQYEIQLLIPSGTPTSAASQVYVAQNAFVSNIVTIPVQAISGAALSATPNPIPVGPGVTTGTTTLSWSAPNIATVEIHVGSPSGPLLATGGSNGSATTGNWVTQGLTFYLQNSASGTPTSPDNTLATVSVSLSTGTGPPPPSTGGGILTASPDPIPVAAGSSFGATTLNWTSTTAQQVEVRIGAPNGQLFATGTATGSALTGAWVSEGMVFYLQDPATGNTLATYTARLGGTAPASSPVASAGTLSSASNPIPVDASGFGTTTLNWSAASASRVEIHVGSPTGPLFAAGGPTGSATTGAWVTNGQVFYLQNADTGATLATYTATLGTTSIASAATPGSSFGNLGTYTTIPGSLLAATTLSWNTSAPLVQLRVNTPDGPLFAAGGASGTAATGNWVTDGMTFFLQNASTGNASSASNTLATWTARPR